MAGFTRANTKTIKPGPLQDNNNESEQKDGAKTDPKSADSNQPQTHSDESSLSFKEILCSVFGQDMSCCNFAIPNLPDNGSDWIDKFKAAGNKGHEKLGAELHFKTLTISGIIITKDKVSAELGGDPKEAMLKCFAMAVIAGSCEDMRNDGVELTGSEQDKAFLFIAAEKAGLKVIDKDVKKISALADQIRAHPSLDIEKYWAEFVSEIRSCPDLSRHLETAEQAELPEEPHSNLNAEQENADSTSEKLSDIFNRAISKDIESKLENSKLSADVYKRVSEDIIRKGEVRKKHIRPYYKEHFNLTGAQVDRIVELMDQEGLTRLHHGNTRVINFDVDGSPKNFNPS